MTENGEEQALVVREPDLVPTMVSDIQGAKARLKELQAFIQEVMVEGEDYGHIPGVKQKVLLKPGAEKLAETYGYAPIITVDRRVEEWEPPGFFHYEVRCELVSKRTGTVVGVGIGSCNSREGKYRWRETKRACPTCKNETIIKGKAEYGGGWICFQKIGGCGVKFGDDDTAITGQTVGRVENDDTFTLVNTILKMAKKRALVDASISVTRSSGLFTQDVEDGHPAPAPTSKPQAAKPEVVKPVVVKKKAKGAPRAAAEVIETVPLPDDIEAPNGRPTEAQVAEFWKALKPHTEPLCEHLGLSKQSLQQLWGQMKFRAMTLEELNEIAGRLEKKDYTDFAEALVNAK